MQTELISKITNEQKDYALGYVRFLEKLKTPKRHFEIIITIDKLLHKYIQYLR